jgi:hypothetical protein
MASTLTRTAAAFAVATLPLIAGATAAQASDSSPKRDGTDHCKKEVRKGDQHNNTDGVTARDGKRQGTRGYEDPPAKMTVSRYGEEKRERDRCDREPDFTKPTEHKKHEKKREHRYDEKDYEKKHHKKDDDKWEKKRDHKKDDDHRKHDRRDHKKHVRHDPLNEVRTATARYFSVAAAERDGYERAASGPLRGCITETPGKNSPAMGFHWMNEDLMDTTIELRKPEALVYEPNSLGKLDLVAVEYVVPKAAWDAKHINPPKLFGLEYQLVRIPGIAPFYALHAWVWKFNPDGTHAAFNPLASCKYASLLPK